MVWQLFISMMNRFNKTEAAIFFHVGYAFPVLFLFADVIDIFSEEQQNANTCFTLNG